MSKKFITVNNENKVQLIHNMPFDSVNGLHKSEAELSQEGYLLDDIPEPQNLKGKISTAYYTVEKGFYYEYEDAPTKQDGSADNLKNAVKAGVITSEQYFQMTGLEYVA